MRGGVWESRDSEVVEGETGVNLTKICRYEVLKNKNVIEMYLYFVSAICRYFVNLYKREIVPYYLEIFEIE